MTGVEAERYRRSIGRAKAAGGAQDQELLAQQLRRPPAHARVLAEPEDVAARPLDQHLGGEWQRPLRSCGVRGRLPTCAAVVPDDVSKLNGQSIVLAIRTVSWHGSLHVCSRPRSCLRARWRGFIGETCVGDCRKRQMTDDGSSRHRPAGPQSYLAPPEIPDQSRG